METNPKVSVMATVIGELRHALVCDVGGRSLLIPKAVLAGSELRKRGDRGRLVVPRCMAFDLGLCDAAELEAAA
jgi:hypothetical protein